MRKYLWYKNWTEKYIEGLPVGNGRLAAMMLGRPEKLRVALNHEWLWRGENRYRECQNVHEYLPEIRKALLDNDFLKATVLCAEHIASPGGDNTAANRVAPYQPVGDIWVSVDCDGIENYKRSLDLETGLAQTQFSTSQGEICQKLFVSCSDDCVVLDINADFNANINICLSRIDDPVCTVHYKQKNDGIMLKGTFDDGVSFEASSKIITDGTWSSEENTICVKNAKHVLLLTQIGTNVKGNNPEAEMSFPEEQCFDTLFERHAKHFAELKGDSVVDIEVEECDLPTDQRIAFFREGKEPSLPLLYFEYGRYLMVSGSSGELPLNLQGKWNEELQPPWESDYHLDINLQMCYWFVEVLGMKHAANTMFNFIEHHIPYAKEVAKRLYNCKGVSFCITSDIWGRSTPEAPGWATWVGATP
jgi:alpha-L-fucosidase 2